MVHVSHKDATWEACDDFERMCAEHLRSYVRSVERRRSEMREKAGEAEKAGVDWTNSRLNQLQREVLELRRREDKLNQLSLTEDPIHFLQVTTCLCLAYLRFATKFKCLSVCLVFFSHAMLLFACCRVSMPWVTSLYSQTRVKDLTCSQSLSLHRKRN